MIQHSLLNTGKQWAELGGLFRDCRCRWGVFRDRDVDPFLDFAGKSSSIILIFRS